MSTLPAMPINMLAVRQIIADIDWITTGRARIDIAHAMLTIIGMEIAANAPDKVAARRNAIVVARDLKLYVTQQYERRRRFEVARVATAATVPDAGEPG